MHKSLNYNDLKDIDKIKVDRMMKESKNFDEDYRDYLVDALFGFQYFCDAIDSGDLFPLLRNFRDSTQHMSKMECYIDNFLKDKGYEYYYDVQFDDIKDNWDISKLRFDFFIRPNLFIEYDGQQHFEDIEYFNCISVPFDKRIQYDNIKNVWCKLKNAKLLRIPYVYNLDSKSSIEKLNIILIDFLSCGIVSDEILNFYSKYNFSNYNEVISNEDGF